MPICNKKGTGARVSTRVSKGGDYQPTEAELAEIDRGLRDAEQSRYATEQQIEGAFAEFRDK